MIKNSPSDFPFTKMQGVGNDFTLIDGREFSGVDWSGLAVEICDRRFGVGADGLLVIDNSTIADATMRMYNPDGTPDFCGNGIRCVARFLAEETIQLPSTSTSTSTIHSHTLNIATLAGVRRTVVADPGRDQCLVTVDMGKPRFDPQDI